MLSKTKKYILTLIFALYFLFFILEIIGFGSAKYSIIVFNGIVLLLILFMVDDMFKPKMKKYDILKKKENEVLFNDPELEVIKYKRTIYVRILEILLLGIFIFQIIYF